MMLSDSSTFSICLPRMSVLSDPQFKLWLLKSPNRIKGIGSCCIMFSMSEDLNCFWFGMYMLQIVILDSSWMDIATTSNGDRIWSWVHGYSDLTSIATPPLARLQAVLLKVKVLKFLRNWEEIDMNISSVFETIEKIRPYIEDRSMKTKLTKLSNLLFQFLPLQANN